jgi:hypothetical protein
MTNKNRNLFPVYADKVMVFLQVVFRLVFLQNYLSNCLVLVCCKFYLVGCHYVDGKDPCCFVGHVDKCSSLTAAELKELVMM